MQQENEGKKYERKEHRHSHRLTDTQKMFIVHHPMYLMANGTWRWTGNVHT